MANLSDNGFVPAKYTIRPNSEDLTFPVVEAQYILYDDMTTKTELGIEVPAVPEDAKYLKQVLVEMLQRIENLEAVAPSTYDITASGEFIIEKL